MGIISWYKDQKALYQKVSKNPGIYESFINTQKAIKEDFNNKLNNAYLLLVNNGVIPKKILPTNNYKMDQVIKNVEKLEEIRAQKKGLRESLDALV